MEKFDALLNIAEKLLSPQGCPWDQKQTFQSLQPYVMEEAHEVIEAVDEDDNPKIIEELGDLLYTIIFYGKLAEKTGRFSVDQIISAISEKLIRRHPHIFGDVKVENMEDIVSNWEKIKKQEKNSKQKVDDLPPTMPVLMRGQKIVKRVMRAGVAVGEKEERLSEEEVGERLLALLAQANHNEIDAESALRRALNRLMERFHKSGPPAQE